MPFTLPDYADAAFPAQAVPDNRDFKDILAAALQLTGVVSGCAVTAQGTPDMTVAVASGVATVGGVQATVTSGNLTIGAADATNPRFDLICVNSSGTKSVVAGTPLANPVFPDPAGKTVLAAIYVPANDTAINANQIVDKTTLIKPWVQLAGDTMSGALATNGLQQANAPAASWTIPSGYTETRFRSLALSGSTSVTIAGTGRLVVSDFPNGVSFTGRTATWTVAAVDASDRMRAQADLKCDGVSDEDEINDAIASLGAQVGGNVFLGEGIYNVATPIVISRDSVTLEGTGTGVGQGSAPAKGTSRIRPIVGFTDSYVINAQIGTRALQGVTLRDFVVDNFNAVTVAGIFYQAFKSRIENVYINVMGGNALVVQGVSSAYPNAVYDNFFNKVRIESATGDGMQFNNYATDCIITDCIIYNSGGHGISIDANGAGNQFRGCYVYNSTGKAVNSLTAWQLQFAGCRLQDCNGGIYMSGTAGYAGFIIIGNFIRNCSNTTDNTTDGVNINMPGTSHGGIISGNSFHTDLGNGNVSYNKMRYCVNVVNANMADLTLGPNSVGYQGATNCFGTAKYNDLGTNTRIIDADSVLGSVSYDRSPSSYTVPSGNTQLMAGSLALASGVSLTLAGTSKLRIIN